MTVRLVGAGCGGPLWLTLEAKLFLERADHVVYDSLIHPDLLQLAPEECAFVGDTVSRDVIGSRRMGFGRVFKIGSFLTPIKDLGVYGDFAPDYEIEDIYDVYTILKRESDARIT